MGAGGGVSGFIGWVLFRRESSRENLIFKTCKELDITIKNEIPKKITKLKPSRLDRRRTILPSPFRLHNVGIAHLLRLPLPNIIFGSLKMYYKLSASLS